MQTAVRFAEFESLASLDAELKPPRQQLVLFIICLSLMIALIVLNTP